MEIQNLVVQEFYALWNQSIREEEAKRDEWIAQLRKQGIAGCHPEDGWVDRSENSVNLAFFSRIFGRLKPGAVIAIGGPDDYHLVRLLSFKPNMLACSPADGRWYFEPLTA